MRLLNPLKNDIIKSSLGQVWKTSVRCLASSSQNTRITVARGDGIGPEITDATLDVLKAAGAKLDYDFIEVGEKAYLSGNTSGIPQEAWDKIHENRVLLKGPITTPQGKGYKSLNVSIRKTFSLYANLRPCVSYYPFVDTKHPKMDVVIVRENEEDLYAGIEHRQTQEVYQCLKLITSPGSERIVRYAFEYAMKNNRKKVTAFVKDNIMKFTDGIFHRVFQDVGKEYPSIEKEAIIVDIGAARLADTPENFDVVVMPNLYGDIMSDIAAQITGSVGLGASANIGENCSMFEAIHGSAPTIGGKNIANPSGIMLSSVMMLVHLGQPEVATNIHNAWLRTMEEGYHTVDLKSKHTVKQLGTKEFAAAVIRNLGKQPETMKPVEYKATPEEEKKPTHTQGTYAWNTPAEKQLVGVDVFVDWVGNPNDLGEKLSKLSGESMKLSLITNRGVKVWPGGMEDTFCVDHWRCRFKAVEPTRGITHNNIIQLLNKFENAGLDFIKMENLYTFNGELGYTLGQGE